MLASLVAFDSLSLTNSPLGNLDTRASISPQTASVSSHSLDYLKQTATIETEKERGDKRGKDTESSISWSNVLLNEKTGREFCELILLDGKAS